MWYYDNVSILVPLCEAVITLFVVANFSLATFMDAGVIPKGLSRFPFASFPLSVELMERSQSLQ